MGKLEKVEEVKLGLKASERVVAPDETVLLTEPVTGTPGRVATNLTVGVVHGMPAGMKIPPPPGSYEAVMRMVDLHLKTLSSIAKSKDLSEKQCAAVEQRQDENMDVSEKQRADAEQRLKELMRKRSQAEAMKRDLDEALQEIWDFLADDEDRRQLEKNRREIV